MIHEIAFRVGRLPEPIFLKEIVHAATPNHGGAEPLRLDESHLRRPITTETPPDHADAFGVDFRSLLQVANHGTEKGICGGRRLDRAFSNPGHVDGTGGEPCAVHGFFVFEGLRFETVDAAKIDHHRMLRAIAAKP